MSGYVVGPDEGTTVEEGPAGGPLTFKARGEETGGALTALESVIEPGNGPPKHVHAAEDEVLYVLEGELRFVLGDDEHEAPAGSFMFVPRGTPHCFANLGGEPAKLLVLFTPSGMERFFDRFAALPADQLGPAAFEEAGAEAGMEIVGPPLRPT